MVQRKHITQTASQYTRLITYHHFKLTQSTSSVLPTNILNINIRTNTHMNNALIYVSKLSLSDYRVCSALHLHVQ